MTEESSSRDLEPAELGLSSPLARAVLTVALLAVTSLVVLYRPGGQSSGGVASATATPRVVTPASSPRPSTAAVAEPSAELSASPRSSPSAAASGSQTPGGLTIASAAVKSWQGSGVTRAQVLVKLRNGSDTPLEFIPSGSRYRILDGRGREVASGVFTYGVPDRIAPGADAYLVETMSALFVAPSDVARVEVSPATRQATAPSRLLAASEVAWRPAADGGLEATGVVRNTTGSDIEGGFVWVLFFDAGNELLGAVYDLTDVPYLEPGAAARFSTSYPGSPPIAPGDVARAEAIAFEPSS